MEGTQDHDTGVASSLHLTDEPAAPASISVSTTGNATLCGVPGCVRKSGSDGLCPYCRLIKYRTTRYSDRPQITPEIRQELRLAYIGNVREVSANLNRLSARTGIAKDRLKRCANEHGWRTIAEYQRRPWTPEENAYLEESLGSVSLTGIARHLKRKVSAVKNHVFKLKRSYRMEGYNVATLCEVFGLSHTRIEGWIRRGLLGKAQGNEGPGKHHRFAEADVVRFIRKHACEYDLSRVDQTWFKAMVFADGVRGIGRDKCL